MKDRIALLRDARFPSKGKAKRNKEAKKEIAKYGSPDKPNDRRR